MQYSRKKIKNKNTFKLLKHIYKKGQVQNHNFLNLKTNAFTVT